MHTEAFAWVAKVAQAYGPFRRVVEFGSLDINGSPRVLFPGADYVGVDLQAGRGVDIVADCVTWESDVPADVVLCLETLEHASDRPGIIRSAWKALRPGGRLILTAACPPRLRHSGVHGGPNLEPGEVYTNVQPVVLEKWLADFENVEMEIHKDRGDVYVTAVRPG